MTGTELDHGSGWVDGERGFGNGAGPCYALPHAGTNANARKPLEHTMPTISMFYGIIICLYFYDDERHKQPHIHAKYQGQEASFSILDGAILAGDIPLAKSRMVQAWIEIHRESLLADWELAVDGKIPFPIDPLR